MATDTASGSNHESNRDRRTLRGLVSTVVRLLIDLLVVTAWVVFLTLFFLEVAWPQWAFYALLIAGIGVYVAVTAAWRRD
ncbi:hypothetical protein Htur_1164 [Haloterrigena turkmenica DSM 5511]|uniref:DUF8119 domain-containing protein n=1 Tax=Haloterrigena turkmenica (strain ATCC 51198 / DSM 5511 / JCM 9101 / NCIMB 13204 / VKM B-1734 / 4k) TaxID=543526 RepID=D2RZD2_HALTV|nr:hypothetical protein [Haloterrigena turkmenica]ADB60056.1 hypothetical protein Htur_1164 [Haloterrigena turkmenica DSM 5511]